MEFIVFFRLMLNWSKNLSSGVRTTHEGNIFQRNSRHRSSLMFLVFKNAWKCHNLNFLALLIQECKYHFSTLFQLGLYYFFGLILSSPPSYSSWNKSMLFLHPLLPCFSPCLPWFRDEIRSGWEIEFPLLYNVSAMYFYCSSRKLLVLHYKDLNWRLLWAYKFIRGKSSLPVVNINNPPRIGKKVEESNVYCLILNVTWKQHEILKLRHAV